MYYNSNVCYIVKNRYAMTKMLFVLCSHLSSSSFESSHALLSPLLSHFYIFYEINFIYIK